MKTLQVSVGIPAYNEQKNIRQLISKLLLQKEDGFKLFEVIVICDGSKDKTAKIVKSIDDGRIKLINDGRRLGQQARQNQILRKYRGDVLVFVEADTIPYDNFTLKNLVKPYLESKNSRIGMVVGRDITETPKTFFEKVFFCGNEIKQKTFDELRGGINLYNSGGHTMRAVSRVFAKNLFFPSDVPEDCYCYLRLKELKLRLIRANNAKILTKNISTTEERIDHSQRFYLGRIKLTKYFDKKFIDNEYGYPKILFAKHLILSFFKSPLLTSLAVMVFALNFIKFEIENLSTIPRNLPIFDRI